VLTAKKPIHGYIHGFLISIRFRYPHNRCPMPPNNNQNNVADSNNNIKINTSDIPLIKLPNGQSYMA
jgi:hypothetical protein